MGYPRPRRVVPFRRGALCPRYQTMVRGCMPVHSGRLALVIPWLLVWTRACGGTRACRAGRQSGGTRAGRVGRGQAEARASRAGRGQAGGRERARRGPGARGATVGRDARGTWPGRGPGRAGARGRVRGAGRGVGGAWDCCALFATVIVERGSPRGRWAEGRGSLWVYVFLRWQFFPGCVC